MQGVANTRLLRTLPAAPGWKQLVFATTQPLPSYLIAFAVGPWDVVDAAALAANAVRVHAVPLRGIAPRGQAPRMRYMLERTAEIVAALEDYFGIAYPYDKLYLLAAPDFGTGAMKNPASSCTATGCCTRARSPTCRCATRPTRYTRTNSRTSGSATSSPCRGGTMSG